MPTKWRVIEWNQLFYLWENKLVDKVTKVSPYKCLLTDYVLQGQNWRNMPSLNDYQLLERRLNTFKMKGVESHLKTALASPFGPPAQLPPSPSGSLHQGLTFRNWARVPCPWACSWVQPMGGTGRRSSRRAGGKQGWVSNTLPDGLTAARFLYGRLQIPLQELPQLQFWLGSGTCYPIVLSDLKMVTDYGQPWASLKPA